jgi:hypothetical protein
MGKDPLVIPLFPLGMSREGDILGNIVILKFVNHEITNGRPFSELAREKYIGLKRVSECRRSHRFQRKIVRRFQQT